MRKPKSRSSGNLPTGDDRNARPGAERVLAAWGIALAVVGGGVLIGSGADDAANTPAASAATPLPATSTALLTPTPVAPVAVANMPSSPQSLQVAMAVAAAAPTAAQPMLPALSDMPSDFVPTSREGRIDNAPFEHISLDQALNGPQAIAALGRDFDAVAAWYGKTPQALSALLLADRTLHVDRRGRLLHIDVGSEVDPHELHTSQSGARPPVDVSSAGQSAGSAGSPPPGTEAADIVTGSVPTTTGAPFALDQTFKLHTRSTSTRVIYLNFRGEGSKPAFDLDKNPGSFSAAEQQMIQRIWLRVAEDYAAFDVDITTEAPTVTTGRTGVTILISPQASSSGGYAYLNSFAAYKLAAPAFCFPNNLANAEKPIAECISHEVGHTVGLNHQGSSTTTYYGGAGDGETGWAPIMGVSYYKNLTQWARGEYNGASNKEDAYAVMARQGLRPRVDDHGNTAAQATGLSATASAGLVRFTANGVIETPTDVDVFSFTVGAGDLTISAAPSAWSGNVDLALELRDATGKTVATGNPVDKLSGSITTKVTAPTALYYLFVKGTGKGDPKTTGYSNYGAIGQYSVTASGTAPPASIKK